MAKILTRIIKVYLRPRGDASFVDGDGPLEFFSKFFTEEVLQLLVEQTNLYAQQNKTRHWED